MRPSRRDLITTGATILAGTGLAGCSGLLGDDGTEPTATDTATETATETEAQTEEESQTAADANAETAVAAEWAAMRARVWDAHALGIAGDAGAGGDVAQSIFERFEGAGGEYGAHEMLEHTSESIYGEFEEALGELRTAGLAAGNLERAREEAEIATGQLAEAQRTLVGESATNVLDLQILGVTALNASLLASADAPGAAGEVAAIVGGRFEEAPVHDALESADAEAYENFEGAIDAVVSAADDGDADAVAASADDAYAAAIGGSYALAEDEATAGAGHLATLQARGWDAAALATLGGPATDYAHAAALTRYRARTHDARWLADAGETERAATVVGDVFADFEEARAHEALEEADHDAYEGFEGGLSALQSAIEDGDGAGIDEALATVDENLVTGIEALAGSDAPLLEAAFFRVRFADARERYRRGESDVAASIAEALFERFEQNELDVHETVESTDEDLYARFEEEHLASLIDAYENGDEEAVATHDEGVRSTLVEFETAAGSAATVSGAEGAYAAARGFDAAVLDALGDDGRAAAIAQETFQHFEAGAGGYHEALEEADHETYEAFEERLGAVSTAAEGGDDVYPAAVAFDAEAVASVYAIIESAGGSHTEAAAGVVQDTFAHFEDARVHELLEEADQEAYETFEGELDSYVTALQDGGDVEGAAAAYADACQYAQFAVVDGLSDAPVDLENLGSGHGGHGQEEAADLEGGPNVVEGVPDDADHVVDMTAVAFEPAELTVAAGDTVAWPHAGGEPHSVTALEGEIPDGANYWASGDFESEEAARSGWDEGAGAVQSGEAYVHTFETTGTHEYVCVPHEAAGMTGSITVE